MAASDTASMKPRLETWVLLAVLAGAAICAISFGVRSTFGVFLAPISAELGWGREVFALSLAIQNIMWGAMQPFAGGLADRYGSARIIAIFGAIYAVGVLLMAQTTEPVGFHLTVGFLVGVGLAGCAFGIVLAAVGRIVPPERRSFAFGIVTAAGSFGQFAVVPLGQQLVDSFGVWDAVTILGFASLIMIPLAFAFAQRKKPATPQPTHGEVLEQTFGAALKEALGQRSFNLLFLGFFVCGFHVVFISTHITAYVSDEGLDPAIGAWAISIVGLFNVAGSIMAGVLGDRFAKKNLLALIYLARAGVIALFFFLPLTETSVLVFAGAMGLLWLSTVPLTTGLVVTMFGAKHLGLLNGFVFFGHQIGSFLGAWLGGYLYDVQGSYEMMWLFSIALGIFAALCHWPIKERRLGGMAPAPA
ncbi:MAG: MFS transporter [Alphaproteobacteria bacterium]|nr:MFS transporter [Alphaproteobacteria bacterium]